MSFIGWWLGVGLVVLVLMAVVDVLMTIRAVGLMDLVLLHRHVKQLNDITEAPPKRSLWKTCICGLMFLILWPLVMWWWMDVVWSGSTVTRNIYIRIINELGTM